MRAYRNAVLHVLKMFPEYTLTTVPRSQNIIADFLATVVGNLKIMMNSSNKFEIHVKHRPSVLDKEKEMVTSSEQPSEEQKISANHKDEVTGQSKSKPIVKFQHLEDKDDLWSMDLDGALGKEGAGIGIWI